MRAARRSATTCRRSCCTPPAISAQATGRTSQQLEARAAAGPLAGRFQYLGELDRAQKIAFLQSLDVFSMPTVYRESKGLPALEAMANAVPVVLPDHGSFTEMIADTGGGLLHRPHDPADLADKTRRAAARSAREPRSSASPANRPSTTATTPPQWPGKRSICTAAVAGN